MKRPQNQKLAAAMAAKGISKREIATAASINPSSLWRLATGDCKPSIPVAKAIANALNVEVSDIFEKTSTRYLRARIKSAKARQLELSASQQQNLASIAALLDGPIPKNLAPSNLDLRSGTTIDPVPPTTGKEV